MELSSFDSGDGAIENIFTLHCIPQETPNQHVLELNIQVEPNVPLFYGIDGLGNSYCFGKVSEKHSVFRVNVSGKVERLANDKNAEVATEESQMLYRYESAMTRVGATLRGWNVSPLQGVRTNDVAISIRDFVHNKMQYISGSTKFSTTAEEAAEKGCGVCQDFAQIMISLCRLQKIPCRYVAGLLLGEGKSHAWVECAINGKWILFDPTNPNISQNEQIIFSRGRDSLDCEINKGVYKGKPFCEQKIIANVLEK